MNILDVNTTAFTVLGYPMSYIELIGTIFNIACVWLVAKKKMLNWPIGILGVVFFGFLFYQVRLYSDFVEQIFYFITGFWGWWMWNKSKQGGKGREGSNIGVKRASFTSNLKTVGAVAAGTLVLGYFMAHINQYFPSLFSQPAALPYLDALTTVMSFAAQILMMRKFYENWILWIAVDVIGIWLYNYRGVKLVSVLYALFLILAINGLLTWRHELKASCSEEIEESITGFSKQGALS